MKTLTHKQLSAECGRNLDALAKGIDWSLTWLNSTRKTSPRLNMEADSLGIMLQQLRNKTNNLLDTISKEWAIGFFGMAQAGKSYLINALAGSETGKMELSLGSSVLSHGQLNPQQLTSTMVIRYSGQKISEDNRWPVQLSLLSEDELVVILVDIWTQRRNKHSRLLDKQQFAERLKTLVMYRQQQTNDGMHASTVVALWQRLSSDHPDIRKTLESHFWPQAMELAPLLGVDDRARLFSLLWNEDAELTALYRQLTHLLHHLSRAHQVLAPLSVVADATQSVLYCNGLRDFNTSSDPVIQVVPQHNGRRLQPVKLTLAELALLSREVLMPLYNPPRNALFEQVDLLDYPGFEQPEVVPDDSPHQLALAFISARRPLLLSRAAEHHDVSLLMVCTASSHRSQTHAVSRSLDNWVKLTQGENAQVRRGRKPALIWALTPFDQRITRGQNIDATVQRYLGNPGDVWSARLLMDKNSVRRMVSWLFTGLYAEAKITGVQEQIAEIRRELSDNLLGRWCLSSEKEEPQERLRVAETLLKTLQARTGVHGELLAQLLPCGETLGYLYLQHQHPGDRTLANAFAFSEEDPFATGICLDVLNPDPLSGPDSRQENDALAAPDAAFARQVYCHWVNNLRQLPEQRALSELLGVSKPVLEMLTAELVTASVRLEVEASLIKLLSSPLPFGTPPEMMANCQVSRALSIIGDFVAWLGFLHLPEAERPDSKINPGKKIFAKPQTQTECSGIRLHRIEQKPMHYTAGYINDWLVALNEMIIQNVGYCAADEVDCEHREQLAAMFKVVSQ